MSLTIRYELIIKKTVRNVKWCGERYLCIFIIIILSFIEYIFLFIFIIRNNTYLTKITYNNCLDIKMLLQYETLT